VPFYLLRGRAWSRILVIMKVVEEPALLPALNPVEVQDVTLPDADLPAQEEAAISSSMSISEVRERAEFMRLAPEWDALVRETRNEPFYRHEFIRTWLDNFAPRARLRVLLARDGGGKLAAALPLLEERGRMLGAPVRRLVSTANDHSCRFDLPAQDGEAAGQVIFAHLAADKSWDVLCLTDVPDGGNAWHLFRAAERAGYPVQAWESLRSPYITLPATAENMQAHLPSKFRANLRRRRRKLEEKGHVTVECVTGGLELQAKLEEGYVLERSGWKGAGGTAISQSAQTWGFYSELARIAAYGGYLSLYFLRVNSEPVAFQYGFAYRDKYYLLKPAYSEAHSDCSPGQLLMDEVLQDCIRNGMKEFDFLGPDMTWKRDWTDDTRPHTWLYIFRDSAYGKMLHDARFKWAILAKRLITRWHK
jgi:CelD/BcsL family acetyltransferase involved in cellulose biosynthesis